MNPFADGTILQISIDGYPFDLEIYDPPWWRIDRRLWLWIMPPILVQVGDDVNLRALKRKAAKR